MGTDTLRSRLRALSRDPRAWLIAALVALWMPVALGRSLWYGGVATDAHPLRMYLAARMRAGELPRWCDTLGIGAPLFALDQPGVFDPLGLLAVLLPGALGADLGRLIAHAILALGARRWLRALDVEDDDATVGAAVVALSGFTVSIVFGGVHGAAGLAWAPWCLATLAQQRAPRGRTAALAAVFLGLPMVAGDVQAAVITALIGLAQALGAPSRELRRRALGDLARASALALALAAVQLAPAVLASPSPFGAMPPADPSWRASLSPRRVIELVAPEFFGEPYGDRWFLRWLYVPRRAEPFAAGIYLGAITLPLAAAAALRRVRSRLDLALGVALLGALALSLGAHAPLGLMHGARRAEGYYGAVVLLAAALAARALPDARRRVDLAARVTGPLSLAMLVVAALMFGRGSRIARALVPGITLIPPVVHELVLTAAGHGAAWLLAYYAVALLAQHGRITPAGARVAAGGLLVLDLAINALPLATWTDRGLYASPSPLVAAARAAAPGQRPVRVLRLMDQLTHPDFESAEALAETLHPNLGMHLGVAHIDPSIPAGARRAAALHARLRPQPLRAMRLHAARLFVTTGRLIDYRVPSLRFAAQIAGSPWVLAVDDAPAPAAYVAARTRLARDEGHARALAFAPDFVPGEDLALEGGPARAAQGRCGLTRHGPERVTLDCVATTPSYAVLVDAHAPGWTAAVNGRDAPILRANGGARAVPIPAGASRVEMRYAVPGLAFGALGSAAALALVIAELRRREARAP